MNLKREVWEGWTVQSFIDNLQWQLTIIMEGNSRIAEFENKKELKKWLKSNQPYYKKDIPEVIEYFANMYKLK